MVPLRGRSDKGGLIPCCYPETHDGIFSECANTFTVFIRGSKKASRPEPLQDASLMVSILLFCRMIFSKKSATFWDHALGDPPVA
jgi:hypothetical protein